MKLLLISPIRAYATKRLVAEVADQKIELTVMPIGELARLNYAVNPADYDALYIRQAYLEFDRQASAEHLSKVIDVARQFKDAGKVVVDQSIAEGDLGLGKYEALKKLRQGGIQVPGTDGLSYPFIAKWNYGFGSKHTYLIKTPDDLKKPQQKYSSDQIIMQEFIKADFEYKLITVGYKSLPVIIKLKMNHNKFLPDLTQPQVLSINEVPAVVELAETAAKILKRELAKVDILEAGGQLYLLEVNRWPGFQHFETVSKFNVAAEFLRYITAACKKSRFPL